MTRTGFRKLYFFSYSLQRTSHDFENNRKTMLMETNHSAAAVVTRREQQEATTHCGSEVFFTLTKETL